MSITIDLPNNGDVYNEQTTAIDGTNFNLIFSFNSRDDHWYMTIRTELGESIKGLEGVKLVQSGAPLERVTDLNAPQGAFFVFSESSAEPGLLDFGNGTDLLYFSESELAAGNV